MEIKKCIKFLLQGGKDYCTYTSVESEFDVKFLDEIYVFTKERQLADIDCKNKHERVTLINVKVLPSNCKIKIPNYFYYQPTVFKNVNLNETDKMLNVDFDVSVKEFKIEHHQIKMNLMPPYENKFMIVYKQAVMPWLTLMFFLIIIVVIIVIYCTVWMLVIRRIGIFNTLLKNHL